MKPTSLLSGLLFLVIALLIGCSGKQSPYDSRPKLILFVCEQFPIDLRAFSELDQLIATHFNYEIIRLEGGYDRKVAQTDYDKRSKLPYWNTSISFEDYLMLRDDGLRLSKQDVKLIERYDLQQTPMIISFDYFGQETGRFSKMRSDEISIRVNAGVAKGKISAGGKVESLEPNWKLTNAADRQDIYSWLSNKVVP